MAIDYYVLLISCVLNIIIIFPQINCFNTESYDEEEEEKWPWNKEEYPNPHEIPPYCGRMRQSFVCDPDAILDRKDG